MCRLMTGDPADVTQCSDMRKGFTKFKLFNNTINYIKYHRLKFVINPVPLATKMYMEI